MHKIVGILYNECLFTILRSFVRTKSILLLSSYLAFKLISFILINDFYLNKNIFLLDLMFLN